MVWQYILILMFLSFVLGYYFRDFIDAVKTVYGAIDKLRE